jgi:hypothetical protein
VFFKLWARTLSSNSRLGLADSPPTLPSRGLPAPVASRPQLLLAKSDYSLVIGSTAHEYFQELR